MELLKNWAAHAAVLLDKTLPATARAEHWLVGEEHAIVVWYFGVDKPEVGALYLGVPVILMAEGEGP